MPSFAFSFRLSKVGSLIEWLLRSFCIYRENPTLRILNSLSSCSDADGFSTAILSYNITWCPFHPMADNDFLYSSSAYYRESVVGWRPCFPCRAFLKHLIRLAVHLCLSEAPCLASRLLFFLITLPGIEKTSRLFWSNSVGLREDFIFLPKLQILFFFPRRHCSQDIAVWKNFRKVRRSRCCSCRRSSPAILC